VRGVRVGWGFDAHRFGGVPPIVLGGVVVDEEQGLEATSDGDVAAHALCDAVLATAALGDIGRHFPSSDPRWAGAGSLQFVRTAVAMAASAGVEPVHADLTVVAQHVRVSPHRDAVRAGLAAALGLDVSAVSVKATTTDGMGFVGRGEGMAAVAVVTGRTSP
jgi:2-C-methyl-D-erythritol 2,4-cyclodiphosphate synthase